MPKNSDDAVVTFADDDATEKVAFDPTNDSHVMAITDFVLATDYAASYDETAPDATDFTTDDGYVPVYDRSADYGYARGLLSADDDSVIGASTDDDNDLLAAAIDGAVIDDEPMTPETYAAKLAEIAANLSASGPSADDDSATAKVTANEKRAALVAAVETFDIASTVSAMVTYGAKASDLFGALMAEKLVACQTTDDPDTWDMDGMRDIATFRNAVRGAFAAIAPSATREPSDPTTGAVMSYIRSLINREKSFRGVDDALKVANDLGVTDDVLDTRATAFIRGLSDVVVPDDFTPSAGGDFTAFTAETLDRIYGAARGGNRVARVSSDTAARPPAPSTIQNGAGGWSTGKLAEHIAHVVVRDGGRTTLKAINKSLSPSYPTKAPSSGAIRNAFMRGVKGFTMEKVSDGYVCRKDA